jgi:hypothetical protein
MNLTRAISSSFAALVLTIGRADGQTARPVVIYLHGRIVEEQGPTAVSQEFGPYLYQAILDSLRAGGFEVVSEVRPRNTDPDQFAARVAIQVDSLLKAGVGPTRIAVIGFSKGGGIAIRAAARIGRPELTFVFMAACGSGDGPALPVAGRMLSVIEASDSLGRSCATLFSKATPGSIKAEREIKTGLRHGAFYQPRSVWLEPVRAWIRRDPLPTAK